MVSIAEVHAIALGLPEVVDDGEVRAAVAECPLGLPGALMGRRLSCVAPVLGRT